MEVRQKNSKQNNSFTKTSKKTFANRNPISYLCTVLKIIVSYHERRRDRPDETLATLYHKEGAKFYFIRHFPVLKIDNTNTYSYFSKLFQTTYNIY